MTLSAVNYAIVMKHIVDWHCQHPLFLTDKNKILFSFSDLHDKCLHCTLSTRGKPFFEWIIWNYPCEFTSYTLIKFIEFIYFLFKLNQITACSNPLAMTCSLAILTRTVAKPLTVIAIDTEQWRISVKSSYFDFLLV